MKSSRGRWVRLVVLALVLVAIAFGLHYYLNGRAAGAAAAATATHYQTSQEADNIYVRFDMEAYDQITANYWQQVNDTQMSQLFQLSLEKADASSSISLATSTRAGVAQMLNTAFEATSTEGQKALAVNTLIVALYNLAPTGRDELLSQQQETALRQEVSNVQPSTDLYSNLGLPKGASAAQVSQAYTQKVAQATTTAEKQQLAYAKTVLTNAPDKARYDQSQIQPTVFSQVFGHTLYLDISQIAPTTIQEFVEAIDAASTTPGLSSMILDFRGNIGGDLSFPQYLLGLFIGNNQYAFDLYHQGTYQPQRTVEPQFTELSRYSEVAVLTDNMTQSTAELTTAALKRFKIAYSVGATTRGWGSVENTYPLTTQIDPSTSYALLLVNSLTLGANEQPIESNGVPADVNIADANWQNELSNYFSSASIIAAIEKVIPSGPLK